MTLFDVLEVSTAADAGPKLQPFIEILEEIRVSPHGADRTARENAFGFFMKLASESLDRSRRPSESIPRAVRDLCQH